MSFDKENKFLTFFYVNCLECLNRVEKITGKIIERVSVNVNDREALNKLFKANNFYAVLHLAALKAVGESVGMPLNYYENNVGGSISILQVSIHIHLDCLL